MTAHKDYGTHFETSDRCFPCHNGITTKAGEDISIGINWRTSMMANAGRDPYWMAGVRREAIDHPMARKIIEDECTICHMPAATYEARAAGHCEGFAVLAAARFAAKEQPNTVELVNQGDVTHALMRAFATQFFQETKDATKKIVKKSMRDKVAITLPKNRADCDRSSYRDREMPGQRQG